MFFEWTQDLSVGIDEMDTQHKKMIDIINDFHAMADSGDDREAVKKALQAMYEYGKMHLSVEEALMAKYDYPYLDKHKKMHNYYCEQLNEYRDNLEKGKKILILDLSIFLKGWLENHIAETDKRYGEFIAEKTSV